MKFKKFWIIIIIILILSFMLTGCWNRRELNELNFVLGLGIDKGEDGKYIVSVQVVDPGVVGKSGGASIGTPVTLFKEEGKTMFEAIRRITKKSPRKLYFSHLRTVVISKEIAKEGVRNVLDFITRDHEFRTDFYLIISYESKAYNILSVITSLEKIPATKMFKSLKASELNWAATRGVHLDEFIGWMESKGQEPILTALIIKGDQEVAEKKNNIEEIDVPARLQFNGFGVFKDDKLLGFIHEDHSKSINYIHGIESTVETIPLSEKEHIVVEIKKEKTDIKAKLVNGKPLVKIDIEIEGNIGEVLSDNLDLSDPNTFYEIENKTEEIVSGNIEDSIKFIQENFGSDVFGFGEEVRRQLPDYWKEVKEEWSKEFIELHVEVNVEMKIKQSGTLANTIHY